MDNAKLYWGCTWNDGDDYGGDGDGDDDDDYAGIFTRPGGMREATA